MGRSLDAILRPRSIAVVGASRDPAKLGHVLLKNVLDYGFAGEVYPVNPSGGQILDLKTYRSIRELPRSPDLVLLSIPSRLVPAAVRDAARRRAKAAVILSSGFGEMGGDGAALQRDVRRAKLRIVGPNCMGVYHLPSRLNATYFWDVPRRPGNLAFVSQSGAYGGMLLSELRRRSMGLSTFLSIGNQAGVTHADAMEQLAGEREIEVVALFIEEIRDGRRFLDACRRLARRKAVVAFKVGRTRAGRRAALSHTGSMAGDAEVVQAALRQAGATVARDTDEFFDALAAYSAHPRGLPAAGGLGIVTISGGPCVAAADACEEAGIPVPELAAAVQRRVRLLIPEFGAARNPVDMTPQMDPARMAGCVEAVSRDPNVGALLAIDVGLDKPEFADAFLRLKKPVFAFVVDAPEIARRFAGGGVPIFSTPERAVRALAMLRRDAPVAAAPRDGALDEHRSKRLLAGSGIPFCREERAACLKNVLRAADRIGYPVALKSLGAGAHKARAGGVRLGLRDARSLEKAYGGLRRRFGAAVVVQEMVEGEHELLVGARRDPVFGPVVLFGAGGVRTEQLRDLSIRVGSIGRRDALAMIRETEAGRRLGAATAAVANILLGLSRWMARSKDADEVDVNPVIVRGRKAVAVDALVVGR